MFCCQKSNTILFLDAKVYKRKETVFISYCNFNII